MYGQSLPIEIGYQQICLNNQNLFIYFLFNFKYAMLDSNSQFGFRILSTVMFY